MNIDPKYLGNIQCFNYDKQCLHGEGSYYKIELNVRITW